MNLSIDEILLKEEFTKADIISLLSANSEKDQWLINRKAREIRSDNVGNNVYLRGLIEYSNRCAKNCLYCGIRTGNISVNRYDLKLTDVINAAVAAYENEYGSVVIQTGERCDKEFIMAIDNSIKAIKKLSKNELAITLSCGEQTEETYQRWFDSGASKYLLRIESSNPDLYYKIHPKDWLHDQNRRIEALSSLRRVGYHVGSGMMIGLPFQTVEDLADDLLFLKSIDVDMVGMGPYIEHAETPMFKFADTLLPQKERLELSLRMIAIIRIMMKDINIASATSMDTIDPKGRIKAIEAGANVLMPNLTPADFREKYYLYNGKPVVLEAYELLKKIKTELKKKGFTICFGEQGNSLHYLKRY